MPAGGLGLEARVSILIPWLLRALVRSVACGLMFPVCHRHIFLWPATIPLVLRIRREKEKKVCLSWCSHHCT